jgi:hypothetical protein
MFRAAGIKKGCHFQAARSFHMLVCLCVELFPADSGDADKAKAEKQDCGWFGNFTNMTDKGNI